MQEPAPTTPLEEREYLAGYDASRFPHPSVTVDVALVTVDDARLKALLVRRDEHPAKDKWALPGGFVGIDESLEDAVRRVMQTKVGRDQDFLEQLYTFGDPARDPRTRVITIAYYGLVDVVSLKKTGVANGRTTLAQIDVAWEGETGGPAVLRDDAGEELALAFDHAEILGLVVQRLRGKLNYTNIGFELLPDHFTLLDVQKIHEAILGRTLNKDSFRRKLLSSGQVEPTGKRQTDVGHRPAELFRLADSR